MKCQILFSGKNKKNNIILSSAENAQRVVKVKVSRMKYTDIYKVLQYTSTYSIPFLKGF